MPLREPSWDLFSEEVRDTSEEGSEGTSDVDGDTGEDSDCDEYLHPDTTDRMSARIISRLIDLVIFCGTTAIIDGFWVDSLLNKICLLS